MQRVNFLCSVFASHTIMAGQIGNLIDEKELTPIYVKGNTTSTSSNFFIDSNPKAEGFLIGVGGEDTTSYQRVTNKITINSIEGSELKEGNFYLGVISLYASDPSDHYTGSFFTIENNTSKNLKLYFQFTNPVNFVSVSASGGSAANENIDVRIGSFSFVQEVSANSSTSRTVIGGNTTNTYSGITYRDCKVTITFL